MREIEICNKKYLVLEENNQNKYRKIFILEDDNKNTYRLLVEDYRNAKFIVNKFHRAYINLQNNQSLKTIKIEDIKY